MLFCAFSISRRVAGASFPCAGPAPAPAPNPATATTSIVRRIAEPPRGKERGSERPGTIVPGPAALLSLRRRGRGISLRDEEHEVVEAERAVRLERSLLPA